MSDTNQKRLISVDAAKGIGITLMFLGHMQISEPLLAFIYSFHMPLFIIISGFLFRADKPFGTSVKRRAKALLIPYLYTNIAALCVRYILLAKAGNFTLSGAAGITKAQAKATLLGMGFARNLFTDTESVGPIWFVPFLFGAYMLFLLTEKICKSEITKLVFTVFLSFLGCYIGTKIAFLPWSFDASLVALPLLYTGKLLKKNDFFRHKYAWIFSLLSGLFWILFYRKTGMVALVTRAYTSYPLCLLTSIAGSIFILYILHLAEKNQKSAVLLKPIAWCGRHSMLLLAVHTVELWHIGWLDTIQSKCPNLFCSYIVYLALLVSIAAGILLVIRLLSPTKKRGHSDPDK